MHGLFGVVAIALLSVAFDTNLPIRKIHPLKATRLLSDYVPSPSFGIDVRIALFI